jgi:hypothetical protein
MAHRRFSCRYWFRGFAGLCCALLLWFGCAVPEAPAQDNGWLRGRSELVWSPTVETPVVPLRYHAYVIGIDKYKYSPPVGWDTLKTAENDARAVAEVLEDVYGFDVKRLIGKAATRVSIMEALDEISSYTLDDAVLIYFAGHGIYEDDIGEGFWIPYGAKRKTGSKTAKHDWIWNSVITKMVGASHARHVLIIADACYAGSLFRGKPRESANGKDITWYLKAMTKPSRYLITSTDYEPALDTGARNSVFATVLLNALRHPEHGVFSASDIGHRLRDKVAGMTRQHVRMGPLGVPSDAGGEFVFLKDKAALGNVPTDLRITVAGRKRGPDSMQTAKDVAILEQRGAVNTVRRLVKDLALDERDGGLMKAVTAYVNTEHKAMKREAFRAFARQLQTLAEAGQNQKKRDLSCARPRVMACIGPVRHDGGTEDQSKALLYRIALITALEQAGSVRVVARDDVQCLGAGSDALGDALNELEFGVSDVVDPRARLVVGRLLPACCLLFARVVSIKETDVLCMRLVDTETSEILHAVSQPVSLEPDNAHVWDKMAEAIVKRLVARRPMIASARPKKDYLEAGIGIFHKAHEGMRFQVIATPKPPLWRFWSETDERKEIGEAVLSRLGELESQFSVEWSEADRKWGKMWLKERTP